jgi:hypothetical protein
MLSARGSNDEDALHGDAIQSRSEASRFAPCGDPSSEVALLRISLDAQAIISS